MRDTHRERERERQRERETETQAEGEAGSMQGARCGTLSRGLQDLSLIHISEPTRLEC